MLGEPEFMLHLMGHAIRVIVESPTHWADNGMGRASLTDQTIRLNDRMPNDVRASTLLHELTHLISDMCTLELSETQVDCVALGFFNFIKDNPQAVADIMGRRILKEID